MSLRSRPRRSTRAGSVLAAVALTAALAAPSAAQTGSQGLPPVVDVAGVEVPVRGSFATYAGAEADRDVMRGLVHGVQRVDGATVAYLSTGVAEGGDDELSLTGVFDSTLAYEGNSIANVTLVDRAGAKAYRPLRGGGAVFSTKPVTGAFMVPGDLYVVWVAFPELPAEVEAVDVLVGWTQALVEDVEVGEGLLEPTVDEEVPLAGEGWPKALADVDLALAEPELSVYDLISHRSTTDQVATISESPQEVAATLDANVLFDKSAAALTPAAQDALAAVGADIAARATGEVVVVGHTDSDGSSESNQVLSQQRADAVVAALAPLAGPNVRLVAQGRGEDEPIAPNDSEENMQANRRVTVTYQVQEGGR